MIIPDINLLIYAYNPDARDHTGAKKWWEELLQSSASVALPWIVVLGFIRLSTTRGVFVRPASVEEVTRRVDLWFEQPGVFLLQPGRQHWPVVKKTLAVTAGGSLTTDAHLAALAIEYQAELQSTDADFSRFPGLRWRNPLAAN